MKKKTKIITIGLLLICVIPVSTVLASERRDDVREIRREAKTEIKSLRAMTASSSEKSKAMKNEIKSQIEIRKVEIKKEIETIKDLRKETLEKKLDEKAKNRVQAKIDIIFKKLVQNINKLSKIDSEVLRRIKALSLKPQGVSPEVIASLNASYASAQDLLIKAKADINVTKETLAAELNASTSKEVIRSVLIKADTSTKVTAEAYRNLLKTIQEVKISINTSSTTSTSTIVQ
jgi:hypothetical protein